MVVRRARIWSLLEWLTALACIIGVAAIASVFWGNLKTVSAVSPVIAHEEPLPDPPAVVPARSVSVPVLPLPNGGELHVGDAAVELSRRLPRDAEVAPPAIDRTPSGERVTKFYVQAGLRFAVVLAPLAGDPQLRIAAIYVPSSR
jgi:hypothetical protein